ncbi:IS3 family transposase [Ralstonia solanacearum]|uniref:IS3 family transposase n=1 Tax=Ralstonia solanacearum TaxID=305 RepID=UPI003CC6B4E6
MRTADAAGLGQARRSRQRATRRPDQQRARGVQAVATRGQGIAPRQRDSQDGQRVFCAGGARPPTQVVKAYIDRYRDAYGVEPICKVLQIAPSCYRRHAARLRNPALRSQRAQRDDALIPDIERVWHANWQVYGADKVWKQMNREGIRVARCTVERLMKRQGLQGVRRGKVVRTTTPDTSAPCPLDRVQRVFKAERPNQLWVSDFTYVSTWQGWLYVAFVIDVFARRIVGWRVSRTMRTDFVLDALEQALYDRQPASSDALVHHSDRGSPVSVHSLYRATGRSRHRTLGRQPWRQL